VWLLFVLLLILIPVSTRAAGEYRMIQVESLKVTIDSEWAVRAGPGYLPVRFDITNLGEARVIEITGQGNRYFATMRGGAIGGIAVRQAVRLARGDHVRLTIPVPIFADSENIRFDIREDGRTLERFNFTGFQSGSVPDFASALIVADPGSVFGKAAAGWPRKITGGSTRFLSGAGGRVTVMTAAPGRGTVPSAGAATLPALDFLLDPARLPTNWLGFTSVRAVVIGPREWEQLNDAQKDALRTWTACGGDLLFVDGDLGALFPAGQGPPALAPAGAARGYYFGRIHLLTSEAMEAGGLDAAIGKAKMVQDADWALPANGARGWGVIGARGFRLPIPGVGAVPARAYLSILIVFSILIGPVNYWFLRRRRQQVLLVLTTPIISAMFILLLAGYVLAGEGLGVRGRAVSFTMLDQVRKQAVTRASVSLYAAGMTPGGGLHFPRDVAVFPIGTDGSGSREQLTMDLTDAQRFTSGAIRARTPANFEEIGFRPARERLTFTREAGGISVMNGLGATITGLLYHDGGTRYRLAGPLPQGAHAILTTGAGGPWAAVPSGFPQSPRFDYLFEHPPDGAYLAILDRSPFWEPGVTGVDERGSFHFLLGWPGGQP
jgi:hypothetical protein